MNNPFDIARTRGGKGLPLFNEIELRAICLHILEAVGVNSEDAEFVSNSLIEANLMGHDSHGILKLINYVRSMKKGVTRSNVKVKVLRETSSTAVLDGNWGLGQIAAKNAMELAIQKAKVNGIGAVAVAHCNHIGRLGEYSTIAAEKDMIGIILINSAGNNVAPYGGIDPMYGTNPLSIAIPTGLGKPILLDMATSIVAGGKVRIAKTRGEKIPEGWIIDRQGHPSTNPDDLYDDEKCIGALLPFGGYKGSGLGLVLEIIGGVLVGAGCGPKSKGNGPLMIALNIESFMPLNDFKKQVDSFIMTVKNSRKKEGVNEILLAGELEFKTKEKRRKEGIFIEDSVWNQIKEISKGLNIDLEIFLKENKNLLK